MKTETDTFFIEKASRQFTDWIAQCQEDMAWETENLPLNHQNVVSGVKYIFEHPERGFYVIAKNSEQQPVAVLLVLKEWSDWRNGDMWWLHSVYVTSQFRGKHVFSRMFHFVVQMAKANRVRGIRLYVDKTNVKAQAVYEKLGMTHEHYELYEKMF